MVWRPSRPPTSLAWLRGDYYYYYPLIDRHATRNTTAREPRPGPVIPTHVRHGRTSIQLDPTLSCAFFSPTEPAGLPWLVCTAGSP